MQQVVHQPVGLSLVHTSSPTFPADTTVVQSRQRRRVCRRHVCVFSPGCVFFVGIASAKWLTIEKDVSLSRGEIKASQRGATFEKWPKKPP